MESELFFGSAISSFDLLFHDCQHVALVATQNAYKEAVRKWKNLNEGTATWATWVCSYMGCVKGF